MPALAADDASSDPVSMTSLLDLQRSLVPQRDALITHPLYQSLATLRDVQYFMEQHVFAVWDFMSLLKSLQHELTCVEVPWVPRGDRLGRRLINEIVLGEESDDDPAGGFTSHFELYRAAMVEAGADVRPIDAFVESISDGTTVEAALDVAQAPAAARRFVTSTFETIRSRSVPRIASAFTLGREDIIPAMFVKLVEDLAESTGGRVGLLRHYLERHIHVDADRHGPMAAQLLEEVCGSDLGRWDQALTGAREALVARSRFWTEIQEGKAGQMASIGVACAAVRASSPSAQTPLHPLHDIPRNRGLL